MFSAKEAGYKAIFPYGRRFIGFHDARIELDLSQQQFRVRYLGDHKPNSLLDSGIGYWHCADGHVLTIFVLE
jgi:4'-phosphopantetheinyl transferase EntD